MYTKFPANVALRAAVFFLLKNSYLKPKKSHLYGYITAMDLNT